MQPRILDATPVPGGLQLQAATGAGPETDCFGQQVAGISTRAVPAIAPLSVGGEQSERGAARRGTRSGREVSCRSHATGRACEAYEPPDNSERRDKGTRSRTWRAPATIVARAASSARPSPTDVASEVSFAVTSCVGPSDSTTAGGARAADDYPGMDASESYRGPPAARFKWNAAKEGSGPRNNRKAPITGPAAVGTREYA